MAEEWHPPGIDVTVAHPARMYDYYLGGKDNFAADREAADNVMAVLPEGRDMALANRAFLGRVVHFLAEAGIDQYLDIGTGIPNWGNTGEVARQKIPQARVVYVDNDPIVLTHTRALLAGAEGEQTAVIRADLRDPEAILTAPDLTRVLDLERPVAVLLVAVLHFIRDSEDPYAIVSRLIRALAPGSYLVISHGTQDFDPDRAATAVRFYEQATAPFVLRNKPEIQRFFDDLELVDPGLVQIPYWRPDQPVSENTRRIWLYGAVAQKY
jgi:SAM-dependent methyltransferase